MKKNNILRAAALLLACCMFSLCTITGTMARYVKAFPGTPETVVRAGLFKVMVRANGSGSWVEIASASFNSQLSLDLYTTLLDLTNTGELAGPEQVGYSATDDVADIANIIAPGTGGEFKLEVRNDSEVDVDVFIMLGSAFDNTGGPYIEWKQSDNSWDPAFPGHGTSAAPIRLEMGGALGTTYETFSWRWAFDKSKGGKVEDSVDTGLGVSGGSYTLPITIAAAQVLPSET